MDTIYLLKLDLCAGSIFFHGPLRGKMNMCWHLILIRLFFFEIYKQGF